MNLFVGNLSPETNEQSLEKAFSEFGELLSVKVIRDNETGVSKGFAFVEMADKYHALDAIDNIDMTYFEGQVISVKEAKPKNGPGGNSRGGGGGFNRNRGGGGGFNRGGGGGFNRDRSSGGGYNRDNGGGYNRDRSSGGGYSRDNNGGGYNREGGYNRDNGGYNRDNGYNRDRNSNFNRDENRGGYKRDFNKLDDEDFNKL
ncbi:MAG: RNA-binding protein [Bacteroidetes bacterium]|nr:RNA-binding protein [Bacteroidota bacterium]